MPRRIHSSALRFLALLLVASVTSFIPTTSAQSAPAGQCGVWRWSVKTLSDAGASQVNFAPVARTITQLRGLVPPSSLTTTTPRKGPVEFRTYRIRARLKEYKRESDHDFHVVIADPNNSSRTMVAEVVDPTCPGARDSTNVTVLQAVRQTFVGRFGEPTGSFKAVSGQPVTILVGVGFFDQCGAGHKPKGAAPNCIELHPILEVQSPP